jgi:hypothetical protein
MDELSILRRLTPTVGPAEPAEEGVIRAALLDHIDRRSHRSHPAGRIRHRLRRPSIGQPAALAIGALLLAGVVSVVGAAIYLGEWGPVEHPATARELDAEITSTIAVTPLPAGRAYPVAELRARAEPAGSLTRFAGVQQVQFYAMCAWSGSWLDADQRNDQRERERAADMIAQFSTWQSVADVRLAGDSIRNQVRAVVGAARSGDRAPMQDLFDAMMCGVILGQ